MSRVLMPGYCWLGLRSGLLFLLLFPLTFSHAQTALSNKCEHVVSLAENLFFNARFDEATVALEECLPLDVWIDAERAEIHFLLARIYFASQKKALATQALENLFDLRPDFEPQATLPPPFLKFIGHIREIHSAEEVVDKQLVFSPQIQEEKPPNNNNNRRWLLIGGGGIFAATAFAIVSGTHSNTPNTFPPAPGPPGGQ